MIIFILKNYYFTLKSGIILKLYVMNHMIHHIETPPCLPAGGGMSLYYIELYVMNHKIETPPALLSFMKHVIQYIDTPPCLITIRMNHLIHPIETLECYT